MSMEAVKGFMTKVIEDPAVAKELALEGKTVEETVENALALGSKHGFDFTAEEWMVGLRMANNIQAELTEEQLEAVAGGLFTSWVSTTFSSSKLDLTANAVAGIRG